MSRGSYKALKLQMDSNSTDIHECLQAVTQQVNCFTLLVGLQRSCLCLQVKTMAAVITGHSRA